MRDRRLRTVSLTVCLISVAAGPNKQFPSFTREWGFIDGFRCSHYLHLAVQLQQLGPDCRAKRLRQMAADAESASELFPLCRMLFDSRPGGKFRRPTIGGATFVGNADPFGRGSYEKWPLEPITLRDGVPILIVRGEGLLGGGRPEGPDDYVEYCLAECRWRDTEYAEADPKQIRKAVEAFIAATPGLSADDVMWLRQQAE